MHKKIKHNLKIEQVIRSLNGIENEDYVICKICNKRFLVINEKHCSSHGISTQEYKEMFPNNNMRCNKTKLKTLKSIEKTNLKLYGVRNIYQREDIRNKAKINMLNRNEPNSLERIILNFNIPNVKFVGNGKIWINCFDKPRVPDFILEPFENTKKIIEVFGDYWHDKWNTGMEKSEHEKHTIKQYKLKGYDYLIIWEYEFANIDKIKNKIITFINKPSETTR